MGSIAVGERNKMLDAFSGRADYTQTPFWVQLHTGDPGVNGTANVAASNARVQATFGSAAAAGAITNTADVVFLNLQNVETITWVSVWSASVAGTFKGSDDITSAVIALTDNLRLPTGQIQLSLT
jgi:hypothetical protein